MDLYFKAFYSVGIIILLCMVRMIWHGATSIKLENEVELREHELRVLKLQLETEKARLLTARPRRDSDSSESARSLDSSPPLAKEAPQ